MSKGNDDFAKLLAIGLIGVGVGVFAAAAAQKANEDRRRTFLDDLRAKLKSSDLEMVGATFGRGPANAPFWDVTLWNGLEVQTIHVPLPLGTEPFAGATCADVANMVAANAT